MDEFPKISIVVPTYNEARNIRACLESIFSQDYPREKLEVFVVDNHSTDETMAIAREFPVITLTNDIRDAQSSKMLAFNRATGELFFYMDADLRLRGTDWFAKMLRPLVEDPTIVGSFTRLWQIPGDGALNRFLTHDPLQRDPIYEFFSPSIASTIVEQRSGYALCRYTLERIPPAGRCLYRRDALLKTPIATGAKFMELDNLVFLVKAGCDRFAYVPEAGEYHAHAERLGALIAKRRRNITRNFLPDYATRQYRWFDVRSARDVAKIILWIIYANLVIPALLRGTWKAVKYRDIACLWYEPLLTLVLTDVILWTFVSRSEGRQLVRNML